MSATMARIISGIGRSLIAAGLLILLFAGFQLWGTGLAEARAQSSLENEFLAQLAEARSGAEADATPPIDDDSSDRTEVEESADQDSADQETEPEQPDELSSTAPNDAIPESDSSSEDGTVVKTANPLPPTTAPKPGDAVGLLKMPTIGVTKTFVAGTSRDILRSGPGHYEGTPLPGQPGNAAIAGHRTTHGAPFFDIHKLKPGDQILVDTLQGSFTYEVEGHDNGAGGQIGHFIVDPSEVGVIADKGDNRLTLTACHPQYSAKQRIIVSAVLVSNPAPAAVYVEPPDDLGPDEQGDGGQDVRDQDGDENDEGTSTGSGSDSGSGDSELAVGDIEAGSFDPSNTLSDSSVARSLGWQPDFARPTAVWAGIAALIAFAGWLVGRFWRRWPAYAMTIPPFGLALFYCFTNLDKFIPAV